MMELLAPVLENARKIELERIEKASLFAGDFIAMDICRFVERNSRYITQNTVVEYLRGLKVKLNTRIEETDAEGRYTLLKSQDISSVIENLGKKASCIKETIREPMGRFIH